MEKPVIAVHACGFDEKNRPCLTSEKRLRLARKIAEQKGIQELIISGGVPYKKNQTLLAYIMASYLGLIERSRLNIHFAVHCYNSSTDIQNILSIAQEQGFNKIYAVSSFWHLWALKPIYKYWIKKSGYNIQVETQRIKNDPAGLKTVFVYLIYSFLVRLSLMFGFFSVLDNKINQLHSKRLNGYPVSGCD